MRQIQNNQKKIHRKIHTRLWIIKILLATPHPTELRRTPGWQLVYLSGLPPRFLASPMWAAPPAGSWLPGSGVCREDWNSSHYTVWLSFRNTGTLQRWFFNRTYRICGLINGTQFFKRQKLAWTKLDLKVFPDMYSSTSFPIVLQVRYSTGASTFWTSTGHLVAVSIFEDLCKFLGLPDPDRYGKYLYLISTLREAHKNLRILWTGIQKTAIFTFN